MGRDPKSHGGGNGEGPENRVALGATGMPGGVEKRSTTGMRYRRNHQRGNTLSVLQHNGILGSRPPPEDPRRTKQIRNDSSRDQRALKTNFAACQGASELRTHAPLTASGYDAERENDRFQPAASQGESHGPERSLHRPPREGGAVPVEDSQELPRGHAGRWPDLRRRYAHRTDQARPGARAGRERGDPAGNPEGQPGHAGYSLGLRLLHWRRGRDGSGAGRGDLSGGRRLRHQLRRPTAPVQPRVARRQGQDQAPGGPALRRHSHW